MGYINFDGIRREQSLPTKAGRALCIDVDNERPVNILGQVSTG